MAGDLTVVRRTPNFVIPTRNRPLAEGELGSVKAEYPARRRRPYRTSHAVKAQQMPGLLQYTWGVVETLDGSASDTYLVAQLSFDSKEQLLAAMASPEGQAATADMADLPHNGFAMHTYADA